MRCFVDPEGGEDVFLSLEGVQMVCEDKETKAVGIEAGDEIFANRVF